MFDLPGAGAAAICEADPAAYRKRLSRARERIRRFIDGNRGLINAGAACRCARRVTPAIQAGRVGPHRPLFAGTVGPAVTQVERLRHGAD